MARIVVSITVKRPIDEVFAVLSDWTNSPTWISGMQSVAKTSDGPIGVGTTYQGVGKALGRKLDADLTVTELEPNRRYEIASTTPSPSTMTFVFESVDGGTRVNRTMDSDPASFFKLAEPLLLPMMKRAMQSDFVTFRDLMEAGALAD
jgi:carbon monoxide dehydrogenase subunit G